MAATSRLRYRGTSKSSLPTQPQTRDFRNEAVRHHPPSLEPFHDGCGGYSAARKSFFSAWQLTGDRLGISKAERKEQRDAAEARRDIS